MTVRPIRLPNGKLLVPAEPDDPDDAPELVEVGPGHPRYDALLAVAEDGEDPRPGGQGQREDRPHYEVAP